MIALDLHDRTLTVYDQLVHMRGRVELANDLAAVLMNKALLLEKGSRWEEALACDAEAIALSESCVKAGMTHLTGSHLQRVRYRLRTFLDLRRWEEAAGDVVRLLGHASPLFQAGSPPESVVKEVRAMLGLIRALPEADRAALDAGLGENAEEVRRWTDD